MDSYGGGTVEEWTSHDKGNTWKRQRDLTPDRSRYPGWKHNNIRPVTRSDGNIVDGMLPFYGWKATEPPEAQAFLLHDERVRYPGTGMRRGDRQPRGHSRRAGILTPAL